MKDQKKQKTTVEVIEGQNGFQATITDFSDGTTRVLITQTQGEVIKVLCDQEYDFDSMDLIAFIPL